MAEHIRQEVEATVILGITGAGIHVTVSIGVNTCIPSTESLIAEFVAGADAALYAAKQAGRNCVRTLQTV